MLLFAARGVVSRGGITGWNMLTLVKEGSLFFALAFPECCVFFAQ